MTAALAVIHYDEEQQFFIGSIPAIPCAHTQGKSVEECKSNLIEVVQLCLQDDPEQIAQLPTFRETYWIYELEKLIP